MPKAQLAKVFDQHAAPPPALQPEAYAALLETLLAKGEGFGKTEPVAAYMLRDIFLVSSGGKEQAQEQSVRVEPLYIVMDLKEWPNEYARSLILQDMMAAYARRMIGEEDINAADFNGSGIWTVKKKNFDFEYNREDGMNENGRRTNIYRPDPDAHRLCLPIATPVTIPTPWGAPWTIGAGGTLALREKDIAALAAALADIRDGKKSAQEALFTQDAKGKTVTRFDVYGMAPGFLQDNYKPVPLKEKTAEISRLFDAVEKTGAQKKTAAPAKPATESFTRLP